MGAGGPGSRVILCKQIVAIDFAVAQKLARSEGLETCLGDPILINQREARFVKAEKDRRSGKLFAFRIDPDLDFDLLTD